MMKNQSRILFPCTLFLLLITPGIGTVSADELYPTITHVFFEKEGKPFDQTVQYTVSCSGHRIMSWNPRPDEIAAAYKTPEETVYSYSATCDHYGCDVYEPYYLNYRITESCDLYGESAMLDFTIRNFSSTPVPPDCYDLQQFAVHRRSTAPNPRYDACINTSEPSYASCQELMVPCRSLDSNLCRTLDNRSLEVTAASDACMAAASRADRDCDLWKNRDDYYNTTPSYDECIHESHTAYENCNQYLDTCDPELDKDCGNWVSDGRYVKESAGWRACRDEVDVKKQACDQYLARVDSSLITMWIDPYTGRESGEVRRECTARFTIPAGMASDPNYVPPMQTSHVGMVDIPGTIWCSIVSFFGGRCE